MTRILPPRRTYRRSGYFEAGELARLWLDELRKADGTALATAAIAHNILDAKELPHDPDLVTTVADRVQSYLRDRAKRGDVAKTGKRRDVQWALAPSWI